MSGPAGMGTEANTQQLPNLPLDGPEPIRRPRGRPTGSKNKPKPPIIITRDTPNTLKAQAMEVPSGFDITDSLTGFARRKQRGVCVLSATGCVANVTLRQPSPSGSVVTLHGRFEILSLLGSILPAPAPLGVTGLSVYLSGPQGQVVGGSVVGELVAAGPVVIMAATFMNAALDRVPLDEEDEMPRRIDISGDQVYGIPQNLLTSGSLGLEGSCNKWASARGLSKS